MKFKIYFKIIKIENLKKKLKENKKYRYINIIFLNTHRYIFYINKKRKNAKNTYFLE